MLDALQCSIKPQTYFEKPTREKTDKMTTISCSNILRMCTLFLIAAMTSTKVLIIKDLKQYKPHTQPLPNLILESRNFFKMIEDMRNVSRREKEYDVIDLPDEEEDPHRHQIWLQYPLDKTRDGCENKVKVKKPTLNNRIVFWLDMGPKFSSDIAGDGPRKRVLEDDD